MLDRLEFGRRRRLPLVLQSEMAECGLACLAMVAGYHGWHTDLRTLRAQFAVSSNGVRADQLLGFAETLRLRGRLIRLDVNELDKLATPCLLHWDLNHFVTLKKTTARGVVLQDPAVGVRHLSYAEIDPHFTGIAIEFTPLPDFQPAEHRQRVRLGALVGKISGLAPTFWLVFAMAVAIECLALLAPRLNQWIFDDALVTGNREELGVLALGALVLMLTQTALGQARGWSLMYASTLLNLQWTGNVFRHLLHLPTAWFEKRHLGDVVSRVGSVGAIQRTLTSGTVGAVLDGMMAVATLGMMLVYSGKLSLIVLVSIASYALLRAVAWLPLREASQEGLALAAKEQSCFLETIRAIQAIKLAGREDARCARWLNLSVDSVNRNVRTQKLGLWFGNANTAISGTVSLLILWIGGSMVIDNTFTIGMLIAFTSYSGQFGGRMGTLIDRLVDFKMLSLHSERLAEIVLEQPEAPESDDSRARQLEPRIELIDVGFRYGETMPWVLRKINLTIEPGESVAMIGPSGCGKTTLIKLILGILQPTEGEVRYGGVPLGELGKHAYRAMLGAVMQDDQLLAGSLRDNLTFFDPEPDQRRVEQCAQRAAIFDDIASMPMGFNSLAGDMGASLSGGQKQRLLLARALYKEPKVLVLDEATSHLEVALERRVNAAISAMNITRVIVAHRPETIASAQRVVTLVGGTIIADYRQSEPA